MEIVTSDSDNRIRYLAQIKGRGLRHVSMILERSEDRSKISVSVKAADGTLVTYVLKEKEYFNLTTPHVSLREISLIKIAKEIEPLLVVFQDESGEF